MTGASRSAVAIGGGTGLPQVLRCLVELGFETSAVVTMADDGGSSGVLRNQLGILPPGDVRNCLVALADDENSLLARVFQYRFEGGEGLAGHALGNLIIAALADLTGDFAQAVRAAGAALETHGHVYPSTLHDVRLHGIDRRGAGVTGQASLAANPTAVHKVFLEPELPAPNPEAISAMEHADLIVVGPGSLYTSVIPNFLVAGVADAVRESRALRVYVCNVANMRGETGGLDAADHVEALIDHGMADAIDVVLVQDDAVPVPPCDDDRGIEAVSTGPEVRARIEALGVKVLAADLVDPCDPVRHEHGRLCRALGEVLG